MSCSLGRVWWIRVVAASVVLGGLPFAGSSACAQGVTVEQVLTYRPSQRDIEIDDPAKEEYGKCELKVDQEGKGSAWVVYGPEGSVIRRFVDSDANKVVDQFRYFLHGLEVYRDVDRDENRKIDESFWFNTAGTRWGVDSDEDGHIDVWKRISAEEASREAVNAMAAGDDKALAAVLINAEDIRSLGISEDIGKQFLAAVKDPAAQIRKITAKSKVLTSGTKWVRFDTSMLMPNLIPSESGKATQDLDVYQNVMAIVQNGDDTGFVQVGEMVRVGDVWKLTGIPRPLEGDSMQVTAGGLLMQPSFGSAGDSAAPTGLSDEVRELLEQMQKLDKDAPEAGASLKAMERYNVARAGILGKLATAAATPQEQDQWLRQQVDGIAAATQANAYPNGLVELQALEKAILQKSKDSALAPYVTFRRVLAEYNARLQKAGAKDQEELQKWWIQQLEGFARAYPKAEDTPDALLQLAINRELHGQLKEARTWYQQLATNYRTTPSAKRAVGALRRLGLVGKPLAIAGDALGGGTLDTQQYRGKVLLVIFWATWCQPCTEDLPQITAMYKQHRRNGFEVVGINIDSPGAPIKQYIDQYKISWPHIHEDGGLESRPAVEYGVISVPTMILAGRDGNVVSVSASVDELKKELPNLLKKQ